MSDDIKAGETTEEILEDVLDMGTAESVPVGVKVCPTCGATSLGTAGSAHGCSTVATVPSKTGKGVVFAPSFKVCAECGGKEHRKLSRPERDLLCAWIQYSKATTGSLTPGATEMLAINPANIAAFASYVATTGLAVRVPKPTGRKKATSAPTVAPVAAAEPAGTELPELPEVADEIIGEDGTVKKRRKSKAERKAERDAAMQAELSKV